MSWPDITRSRHKPVIRIHSLSHSCFRAILIAYEQPSPIGPGLRFWFRRHERYDALRVRVRTVETQYVPRATFARGLDKSLGVGLFTAQTTQVPSINRVCVCPRLRHRFLQLLRSCAFSAIATSQVGPKMEIRSSPWSHGNWRFQGG